MGSTVPPPIGSYDMEAIGLAGYVSSKGWVEISNPASTKISIKMFNINNCGSRAAGKKSEGDEDILKLGKIEACSQSPQVGHVAGHAVEPLGGCTRVCPAADKLLRFRSGQCGEESPHLDEVCGLCIDSEWRPLEGR
jgi:hypothetical protein